MEKQISEKQTEINQLWETINQNQEDNEKQNKAAFDQIFDKDNQLAALGEELKKEKHLKNAEKSVSKWKLAFKCKSDESLKDEKVRELTAELREMENVNEELQEQIEQLLRKKPIETFKHGRYSDDIHEVYHYLTAQGISCWKIEPMIRMVLDKLADEHIE